MLISSPGEPAEFRSAVREAPDAEPLEGELPGHPAEPVFDVALHPVARVYMEEKSETFKFEKVFQFCTIVHAKRFFFVFAQKSIVGSKFQRSLWHHPNQQRTLNRL